MGSCPPQNNGKAAPGNPPAKRKGRKQGPIARLRNNVVSRVERAAILRALRFSHGAALIVGVFLGLMLARALGAR